MRRLLLCATLGVAACTYDTELPATPLRGKVHGAIDPQGHLPAENLTVSLVNRDGAKVTATTGANGAFAFADLAVGSYYLECRIGGFAPLLVPFVEVKHGSDLDLGTLLPTWLGGTSSEAKLRGRVAIAGGADPTGAQVEFLLQPSNKVVALVTVGPSGDFLQALPPATFRLRGAHPLYLTATSAEITLAEAEERDLTAQPLLLDLNPATVTGHVDRERDRMPVEAAPGVTVTVEPSGLTTTTDASGNFSLGGLPAGAATVRFTLAGFHDPVASRAVTLKPGMPAALPPVTLELDRGKITGRVEMADGRPALGTVASVTGQPYSAQVSPEADPSKAVFVIDRVPVGTWEIAALRNDYSRAARSNVVVRRDESVDVGLLTLTALQGDFVIDDGDPSNTNGYTRVQGVTLQLQGFTGAASYRASEDPAFPDAGFVAFSGPMQPFTLGAQQGTHTVYAQYRDGNGAPSPVFVSRIVFDNVPPAAPSIVLNGGSDFTRVAQPLTATLTASETPGPGVDAVAGLREVRLSEQTVAVGGVLASVPVPYQRDVSFTRPSTADGAQTVYAQFFDHAGNWSAPVSDTITIDTMAPSGTLVIPRGTKATVNGYTNEVLAQLSATATAEPNGGFVLIRLANSATALQGAVLQPFSPSIAWFLDPSGADGDREVWWQLQDAAGNQTAPLAATIRLDRTPPSAASLTLVGSSPTNQQTVALNTAATDTFGLSPTQALTVSEDAYFLSAGTVGPQALGASVMFPLSAGDGAKQVYARFRDGAGNEAFASVRVDLDRQPPSGTFVLEGTLADGTLSDTLSATANVTAVVTSQGATLYALGNESMMTCPAPGAAYTALPGNGRISTMLSGALSPRQVKLCLADAAGNVTGPLLRTMGLDGTAPSGCSVVVSGTRADGNPAPAGRTARAAVTVAVSGCSETPAEMVVTEGAVTCTATGLPWVPFQASQPLVLIGADGMHSVRACLRDAAHNVFAPPAAQTDLDSTPPSGAAVLLDSGASWVNLAQYQARGSVFSASAAGTATGATEWSLSTTPVFTMWLAYPATSPRSFTFGATGNQRIYAAFRDDLGNTTPAVTDDITFDIAPPSVAGLSLNLVTGAPDPTFVASGTVSLQVVSAAPADAAAMYPVQVPGTTACSSASYTNARSPSTDVVFITSGGEGAKRICLAFGDAAGNLSAPLQRDFTVDTIPPAAPEIVTPATLNNLPDDSAFSVTTARPVVEANFLRYEKQGGKLASWTTESGGQATTSFGFNLVSNPGLPSVPNVLQLRAVDRAGNIGPQSQVIVTTDRQPPVPPTTSLLGVSNFSQSATVFWVDSLSPDVTRYFLDYGPSPGQYTGAYATEGVSPLVVPAGATQLTLHGLIDGTLTYAQMRAVDAAGNESFPSGEVQLQPNVKSPTVVATVNVPGMGEIIRVVVDGDVAYLVGTNDYCLFTAQTATVITALDLSVLKSATQSGRLTLPLPTVPVLWQVSVTETIPANICGLYHAQDFIVDGAWGYLSTNERVRFVYLGRRGVAPTVSAPVTLPWPVRTLALKGNTLFINGAGGMQALNVAKLHDDNAATLPALATDSLGQVTDAHAEAAPYSSLLTWGSIVVRNRLLHLPKNSGQTPVWNITAPASSTPTNWNGTHLVTTLNGAPQVTSPVMAASGNLLYGLWNGRVSALSLNQLFTGAPMNLNEASGVTIDQLFAQGPISVRGTDIFTTEDPGNSNYFYWVDASSAGIFPNGTMSLASKYFVDPVHRMRSVAQYGNYAIVGSRRGRVYFFELATARALRLSRSVPATMNRALVDGAFAYGSGGSVVDLQAGTAMVHRSPEAEGSNFFCDYFDTAKIDDLLVSTKTSAATLRVVNTADAVDRDPATLMQLDPATTDILADVVLPGVTRVMSLEVWGRLLAVTELRADGIWLEVFDASKLRDSDPVSMLTPASDTRGAIRLTTYTGPNPGTDLALSHGRAFVTLWDGCCGGPGDPSPGFFAVDLRRLVDDDAATTGLVLQGSLPIVGPRDLAVSGNRAYVTKDAMGIQVWDISRAMDDDPATLLNAAAPIGQFLVSGSAGAPRTLTVAGTMVYATNNAGTSTDARTFAIDFSDVASPRIVSQADVSAGGASCAGVLLQGGIFLTGSKLYVGGYGVFHELDIE